MPKALCEVRVWAQPGTLLSLVLLGSDCVRRTHPSLAPVSPGYVSESPFRSARGFAAVPWASSSWNPCSALGNGWDLWSTLLSWSCCLVTNPSRA